MSMCQFLFRQDLEPEARHYIPRNPPNHWVVSATHFLS